MALDKNDALRGDASSLSMTGWWPVQIVWIAGTAYLAKTGNAYESEDFQNRCALASPELRVLPVAERNCRRGNARLNLKPSHGLPGETIIASGRNFVPGSKGIIIWPTDGSELASFQADDDGDFSAELIVPDAEPGDYEIAAVTPDEAASDQFEVELPDVDTTEAEEEAAASALEPMPEWMIAAKPASDPHSCPAGLPRRVAVATADELTAALATAQPGDLIELADGTYRGLFAVEESGTADDPIWICGSRNAVIDGGDFGNGYALHITGDYVAVQGITVTNALKGIMLDDADHVLLVWIEVHTTGHEAIHFRGGSSDGFVRDSDIHNTGLKRDKFGEGIYLGSAVSNWGNYSDGEPDRSDRNQVIDNRIWDTTSEPIDIKEGTEGGLIEGNVLDGSSLAGADSWIDVKGKDYVIRGNHGENSPGDGYQTHVIDNMEWGKDNTFDANIAVVNGVGLGFYIHDPETSNNTVLCTNQVTAAGSGFANLPCS